MGTTIIYKTSQYTRWDAEGNVITSSKNLGGSVTPATDLSNYYTKPQLQTSGEAQVHFENITNAYHNNLLGLEGGDVADNSSGESSGEAGEYYHLNSNDYSLVTTIPSVLQYLGTNAEGVKGWYPIDFIQAGFHAFYLFCEDDMSTELGWAGTPHWHELEPESDGGITGVHTATTTSYTELDRYVTKDPLLATIVPAGVWSFIIYCKVVGTLGRGQIKADIYRVDDTGTIVGSVLGTAETSEFLNDVTVGIEASVYLDEMTGWDTTDRIGVIMSGKKLNATPATVTFYHNLSLGWASSMSTPILLLHNLLKGLNEGDYIHLTAAEYATFLTLGSDLWEADSIGDLSPVLSGAGITVDDISIKNNIIARQDGDDKHLTISAGNGLGATNDGGHLFLRAGNAILSDNSSTPGSVFLIPGNNKAAGSTGTIYVGEGGSNLSDINFQAQGAASAVGLSFYTKGGGTFTFYTSGTLSFVGSNIFLQSPTITFPTQDTFLTGGTSANPKGFALIIQAGGSTLSGGDGGNLYLRGGFGTGAGLNGDIFFGDGNLGWLPPAESEDTSVVMFDPSTGKLSYGDGVVGGGVLAFQTASFADPLEIDCTTYKDWICVVTGDTTINLNNVSDGDAGMLELIIDGDSSESSMTVTFGAMWTKKMGATNFDGGDGADNIISWRAIGDGSLQNIVYTIGIIEV